MTQPISIRTGMYTGDGAARELAPVGNGPDFVLTKRINGAATPAYTHWRFMPFNSANSPGSPAASRANQIIGTTRDGFYAGPGQRQSGAGYAWLTIKGMRGSKSFACGRYYQTASAPRDLRGAEGTPFRPDMVWVHQRADGNNGAYRTSGHAAGTSSPHNGIVSNSIITDFLDDGFSVGNSPTATPANDYVDWWAMKHIPGGFMTGFVTGTGAALSVDVGFRPTCVIAKSVGTSTPMFILTGGLVGAGNSCHPLSAAAADPNAITGFTDRGFTLGTSTALNPSGGRVVWMAFKDGDYTG